MDRVIVFDLDDTLFPEADYVISGFRAVDRWVCDEFKCEGFFSICETLFKAGVRGNIFNLAAERKGIADSKKVINDLLRVYRSHHPTISLFPDAAWALDWFGKSGPIGLLTDGYLETQQNKVNALGISQHFKAIVYTDALGRSNWKPSLVPFQRLMELIPIQTREYVYVSDNPNKDFIAPRKLGWDTVQVVRPNGVYREAIVEPASQARQTVSSLFELKDILK